MTTIYKAKNALITGASGGIGSELTRQLYACGANICMVGRATEELSRLKSELDIDGLGKVHVVPFDLSTPIDDLIQQLNQLNFDPDILVNSAGVFGYNKIEELTNEEFDNFFNLNVKAPTFLMKEISIGMKKNRWGRIINIGSTSSFRGYADSATYCGTKHALLGISRALNAELQQYGIRVYCFCPGTVDTPMAKIVKNIDQSTLIRPSELAAFILHTASYDSDMVVPEVEILRYGGK